MSLEKVVGIDMCSKVLHDQLVILATRLKYCQ